MTTPRVGRCKFKLGDLVELSSAPYSTYTAPVASRRAARDIGFKLVSIDRFSIGVITEIKHQLVLHNYELTVLWTNPATGEMLVGYEVQECLKHAS